jgi:folate-binding protein YgfZ
LTDIGFICLEGADAGQFLRDQLSRDVLTLDSNDAPVAAWHSATGKVKAIFRVLSLDGNWLLVTERELVDSLIADLQRFVLRDQVTIREGGDQWKASALLGKSDRWLSEHDINLGHDSGRRTHVRELIWLRLGPDLVHVIGPASVVAALESTLPPGETNDAVLMEISLGLPWLTPALQNRFIPQMLNLDLLGALDEKKGCYPGQEIIARTQNLGTVKRRMLRYSADLHRAPEAGTAITNDADETVGEVVRAVVADGKMNLLAVTRLSSVGQILNCEADRTVALRAEPLPYQVP